MAPNQSQCPSCKEWDWGITAIKKEGEVIEDGTILLSAVIGDKLKRILTGIPSFDDLVGGGIAQSSVILLGGMAGAGKSTIALQLSDNIAGSLNRETLYIAAEESAPQIKDRAYRLALKNPHLVRLFPMGNQADVSMCLQQRKPCAVIVDSLPGFVSGLEEAVDFCKILKSFAVELDAPFIIIDHVNKADDFAGLEKLKHEVDTTITIYPTGEGEIREMTILKNRFGQANKTIELLMTETGLIEYGSPDGEEDDDETEDE